LRCGGCSPTPPSRGISSSPFPSPICPRCCPDDPWTSPLRGARRWGLSSGDCRTGCSPGGEHGSQPHLEPLPQARHPEAPRAGVAGTRVPGFLRPPGQTSHHQNPAWGARPAEAVRMNKSLAHPGWGIVLLTALASLGSGLAVDALLTSFHTLGARTTRSSSGSRSGPRCQPGFSGGAKMTDLAGINVWILPLQVVRGALWTLLSWRKAGLPGKAD